MNFLLSLFDFGLKDEELFACFVFRGNRFVQLYKLVQVVEQCERIGLRLDTYSATICVAIYSRCLSNGKMDLLISSCI